MLNLSCIYARDPVRRNIANLQMPTRTCFRSKKLVTFVRGEFTTAKQVRRHLLEFKTTPSKASRRSRTQESCATEQLVTICLSYTVRKSKLHCQPLLILCYVEASKTSFSAPKPSWHVFWTLPWLARSSSKVGKVSEAKSLNKNVFWKASANSHYSSLQGPAHRYR